MSNFQAKKTAEPPTEDAARKADVPEIAPLKIPTAPIVLPPGTDVKAHILRDEGAKAFFTRYPSLLNTFRTPEHLEIPGERLLGAANPDPRLIDRAAEQQHRAFVTYLDKFVRRELGEKSTSKFDEKTKTIDLSPQEVEKLEKLGMAGSQRDIYGARYLYSSGDGTGTGKGLVRKGATDAERAEYKESERVREHRQHEAFRAQKEADDKAWHERFQAASLKIRQDPNSLYNDPRNEVARREKFEANLNLMMGKPIDPMMRGVPGVSGAANWESTGREPLLTLPATSDGKLVRLQQRFDRDGTLPPPGSLEGEAVLQLLAARQGVNSAELSLNERRKVVLFGASAEIGRNYGKTLARYAVTRLDGMTPDYFAKVGNSLDEKLIPYISLGSGSLSPVERQQALNQARVQMMKELVTSSFDLQTGVATSYRMKGEAGLQAYAKGIVQLEKTIEGEKSFTRAEKSALQLVLQKASQAAPDVQAAYLREKEASFVSDVMGYVAQGRSKGMNAAYFSQVADAFEKHIPNLSPEKREEYREHLLRGIQRELARENSPAFARVGEKERGRLLKAIESTLSSEG